jgi:hypothetical protein
MYRDFVSQIFGNGLAATSAHHAPGLGWLVIAAIVVVVVLIVRHRGRDRG